MTTPPPISLSNACSVVSAPPEKHPGEILSGHQALLCQTKGIEGINPHPIHSGNQPNIINPQSVVGYEPLGNQPKNKRQSTRPSKSFFIHGNQPDWDSTNRWLLASSPPTNLILYKETYATLGHYHTSAWEYPQPLQIKSDAPSNCNTIKLTAMPVVEISTDDDNATGVTVTLGVVTNNSSAIMMFPNLSLLWLTPKTFHPSRSLTNFSIIIFCPIKSSKHGQIYPAKFPSIVNPK